MSKELSSFEHTSEGRLFSLNNNDVFLLYVAGYINAIPGLSSFMDDLYETNKYTFYEKAKQSAYYDATFMTDRPLEREVSMKRAFGVLLHAEEDEALQDAICKAIVKHERTFKVFLKSFTVDQLNTTVTAVQRAARNFGKSNDEQTAPIYLAAYIVYCKHGIAKKDKQSVSMFHSIVARDIAQREANSQSEFINSLNRVKTKDSINESKYFLEYKEAIKTGRDLLALIEALDAIKHGSSVSSTKVNKLVNILTKFENTVERQDTTIYSLLVSKVFSLFGSSISLAIENISFDQEELDNLFTLAATCAWIRPHEGTPDMTISDYTLALWLALLSKTIKKEREFYFKNNSETQFFALRNLEREVQQLQQQLSIQENATDEANAHAAALSEQISLLNAELAKETKDAAKPLMGEISILKNQIAALESKLQEETEKNAELARLREFVFDMQQGGDIQLEDVSLDSYIDGKKIYIFGGHINWRNKLKQKYPKLEVLDGHNVSFDEQKLLGADMVLMNTSNMSHALYYKIIDVLRKNNIPFDYLGKYSNPNLLEREMGEALLRQKQ